MFAGLKNKIKEETGDDVSKISSKVSSSSGKGISSKGRHSRQGSTTSLGSFTIDGRDEGAVSSLDMKLADGRVLTPKDVKKLESKEEEWRKKLQKKDDEFAVQTKKIEDSWKKKLDEREKEFYKIREKLEAENKKLSSENIVINSKIATLQDEAKRYEGYKNKICQYQDDLDQLEGFQTQEMAKVKHLLLEKEQNLVEKDRELLESKKHVEELTVELRRLQASDRELQDTVDNLESVRHKSEQEKAALTTRLAAEEETTRHMKDRIAVLEARCRAGCVGLGAELTIDERIQGLLGERALLERLLSEAHEHLAEVKTTWSGTITSLETQVGRLCRQASEESSERRVAEIARDDFAKRLAETESKLVSIEEEKCEKDHMIKDVLRERDLLQAEINSLRCKVTELERDVDNNLVIRKESAKSSQAELDEKAQAINRLEKSKLELSAALEGVQSNNKRLEQEVEKLKAACESERLSRAQISAEMAHEQQEKDAMMMRNAEVSQEVELVRQELRAVQQESNDLCDRISQLQDEIKTKDGMLSSEKSKQDLLLSRISELENANEGKNQSLKTMGELKETISDLENQLLEKNKTIKNLQLRVSDMKKTLQRELKIPSRAIDPGGQNGDGFIPPHGPALLTPSHGPYESEDVNFKYLKHVLFKFLTSREYEAQHLTRAVATLLHFNAEEERLLRETMDWKNSWFGSRPRIGSSRNMHPS